jgi:segregation and condensation protein B
MNEQNEHSGGEKERSGQARRLSSIVESLLLVTTVPLKKEKIRKIAHQFSNEELEEAILILEKKFGDDSGILFESVAGGFQLRTNPSNQDYVRGLLEARPPRFSRAALETLSIIAYKQPVTRADIEDIRGVDSQGSIKTLADRRLVRVMGKKEVPGRPFLFGTTREFLELFSLEDLASLPSLSDLEEIMGNLQHGEEDLIHSSEEGGSDEGPAQ